MSTTAIRRFKQTDWADMWRTLEPVFRAGETYPYSPQITEAEAHRLWIEVPSATFVVVDDGNDALGTYYIRPNQPTLGAHVCNCGYVVAEEARGRGIGSAMCRHSQIEAVTQGFRATQYNLVVSTNEQAVRLWRSQGFRVVGTLPGAFRHVRLGFVDAFIMYKELVM